VTNWTAVGKTGSGNRKVSAIELVRLASALDRPIDWFAGSSPPAVVNRGVNSPTNSGTTCSRRVGHGVTISPRNETERMINTPNPATG
jgi:hypothetical protein